MSTVTPICAIGDGCNGLDEGRARVLEERLTERFEHSVSAHVQVRGMHIEFRKRKQQISPVLNERSKVMSTHMNWIQVS
jgi:hypothetical protein